LLDLFLLVLRECHVTDAQEQPYQNQLPNVRSPLGISKFRMVNSRVSLFSRACPLKS
jgi:hypothetical protein